MPITIIHRHVFEFPPGWCSAVTLQDLNALEARIMSALSDKIAEVTAATDAALVRVQEDVNELNITITDLEALVDKGVATQADMDALEALRAKVDALDPVKPETL